VLSRRFRHCFLELLQRSFDQGELKFFGELEPLQEREKFLAHLEPAQRKEWVVYAKAPFAGPKQVLDYVGRYTHRVAISNNRLLSLEDGQVTFRWKDYRDNNAQKTMTLSADEFIRRFLMHVLPSGFQRIRYFGFMGNRYRHENIEKCRRLLDMPQPNPEVPASAPSGPPDQSSAQDYRDRVQALTGISLRQCPVCCKGHMVAVTLIPREEQRQAPFKVRQTPALPLNTS